MWAISMIVTVDDFGANPNIHHEDVVDCGADWCVQVLVAAVRALSSAVSSTAPRNVCVVPLVSMTIRAG